MKLGFAGSGSMAAAMARGWATAERRPEAMQFADSGSGRAAKLAAEVGGTAVASLAELAAASDVIVLAVKPVALDQAAAELASPPLPVISVLGATSLGRLREAFPARPVIRTMPTIAAEIHQAVICHVPLGEPEREVGAELLALLGSLGTLVELEDERMDAATAIMGCTPAYVALIVESLTAAVASEGFDHDLSQQLVIDTFASTAALLRNSSPQAVRNAVASPGGSTEAGLDALEAAGVPEGFADAVKASLDRMRG